MARLITVTRDQVCDNTTCPCCESKNIESIDCGCMCRRPNHSCWSYPKCESCGFTAYGSAGNSNGGIWIPFSKLNSDT